MIPLPGFTPVRGVFETAQKLVNEADGRFPYLVGFLRDCRRPTRLPLVYAHES